MDPYNQPTRGTDQPQGIPMQQAERRPPAGMPQGERGGDVVAEADVSSPTLRRVSLDHPQAEMPIGDDDHVLSSVYNPQMDCWEVLVLLSPDEDEVEDD